MGEAIIQLMPYILAYLLQTPRYGPMDSKPIRCYTSPSDTPSRLPQRIHPPTRRPGLPFPSSPIQTSIVDDRVIWQDSNDAPSEPLVTYTADPLISDYDSPIPSSIASW